MQKPITEYIKRQKYAMMKLWLAVLGTLCFFGSVTMVTVVTVFSGAGSDAKDRHATGGKRA